MIKSTYIKYKDVIHDYFWRSLQLFGKEGITFYIFVISANFLSPFDFGNYNYLMAVIFFLIMFGDFGISAATTKFVAEFDVKDQERLRCVLFNSTLVIFGLAIIISVLTCLIGPRYIGVHNFQYVLLLLPLVLLAPMTSLYDGIFRGLKQFKKLTITSLFVGLPFVPIIYIVVKKYGLIGSLISQDLFYLFLLIALGVVYREWHFKVNKKVVIEICKYSFIIGITSLGYFLFTRINVIILGQYNFIEQIGYYEIINKIFAILLIPFSILSQVLAPRVTRMVSEGKKVELIEAYRKYVGLAAVLSLFLALTVYLVLPFLSDHFLHGYDPKMMRSMLNFLLIVLITQSASNIASVGFSTSSGHASLNMYFLLIFGVLNVITTYTFIKLFGFWGVIYSTVLIKALSDISFVYTYYKYVKTRL